MYGSYSKIAGASVAPSRIVKLLPNNTVVHATAATDELYGITQPYTRRAPVTGWDDGLAAVAGEPVNIFGPGDDACKLELGGTVAIGDTLTSTTDGKGVATTTDKHRVIAIAMEAGVSGQVIKVKPIRFDRSV